MICYLSIRLDPSDISSNNQLCKLYMLRINSCDVSNVMYASRALISFDAASFACRVVACSLVSRLMWWKRLMLVKRSYYLCCQTDKTDKGLGFLLKARSVKDCAAGLFLSIRPPVRCTAEQSVLRTSYLDDFSGYGTTVLSVVADYALVLVCYTDITRAGS